MKPNFTLYPQKKIKPYDGMSITADVWAEAHNYHTQGLNAHQHFLHGAGIVTGLEVIASDPAESVVFILPGVALDTAGQMIVLPEAVAYDLGQKMDGRLRLMLVHREVKTETPPGEENNAPAYLRDDYVIITRIDPLDTPYVELARIDRLDPQQPIHDAANPAAPGKNEIDLRFRSSVCPPPVRLVRTAVCYLDPPAPGYARGVSHLAGQLARQTRFHLVVEDAVPFDKDLLGFDLAILPASKVSQLNAEQAETLHSFLEQGGKLLVEFCQAVDGSDAGKLLKPAGVTLEKLAENHPVFSTPHVFYAPPAGAQPGEPGGLWAWGGAVLCVSAGYGELWSGQAPREQLSRSALRDAFEWGVNLVNHLLEQD